MKFRGPGSRVTAAIFSAALEVEILISDKIAYCFQSLERRRVIYDRSTPAMGRNHCYKDCCIVENMLLIYLH